MIYKVEWTKLSRETVGDKCVATMMLAMAYANFHLSLGYTVIVTPIGGGEEQDESVPRWELAIFDEKTASYKSSNYYPYDEYVRQIRECLRKGERFIGGKSIKHPEEKNRTTD